MLKLVIGYLLGARRDLVRSGLREDDLPTIGPVTVVAVDREQQSALAQATLEALRFVFGNAEAGKRADESPAPPAAPTPTSVDTIGPAASSGPIPGMVSAPIPAR